MERRKTEAALGLALALLVNGLSHEAAELPDFVGAGSCASSACHGSKDPRRNFGIQQNEYSVWASRADRHSRAYETLAGDTSRLIQRNLGLEGPAHLNAQCLACHTLDVAPARAGKTFAVSDGVSCEACHGPAEQWLGAHTLAGWTHEQSVAAGMNDTRDLVVRARTCLGCHLGDERRRVDHVLIAAGHPDLVFELETFSATMPPHWQERSEGTRAWAVGQAAALEAWMRSAARSPGASAWPEFSQFECFSCHHGLVATQDSDRIRRGYTGVPGRPSWNASRWIVFRNLVELLDPEAHASIEQHLEVVQRQMVEGRNGQALSRSALDVAETAGRLGRRLADPRTRLDSGVTRALVAALARDAEMIAGAGYRSAEQAALAVDALHRPLLLKGATEEEAVRRAVDGLFEQLGDPNLYEPAAFGRALSAAGKALHD